MNDDHLSSALVGSGRAALSHLKTISGRRRYDQTGNERLCAMNPFARDEGKICSSKAFRRLSKKAQVVTSPRNPHIRDRMSHTMEVVACSVRISEMLGLNTNLARAIALGHDIGHVPFGHVGEQYIAERTGKPFKHEIMGVVIAQFVERKGKGLNLTHEVLRGMHQHGGGQSFQKLSERMTSEARVVRLADKIAYIFADLNDFARFKYPLPPELVALADTFGHNQRNREATVINALCRESEEAGNVEFSKSDEAQRFGRMRELMYKVYPRVTVQDPRHILDHVFSFIEHTGIIDPVLAFSVMTDDDIIYLSQQSMLNTSHLFETALGELFEFLKESNIDYCSLGLDW